MSFIWSLKALESLLYHKSEDVRSWAIARILDLYADSAERLLTHVPSASPGDDLSILRELAKQEGPVSQIEPLLQAFRNSPWGEVRELAGALLLRSGCDLPPDDVKRISLSLHVRVMATTERGFDHLLRFYRASDGPNLDLLVGLSYAGGFAALFEDLREAETVKERAEIRKLLEKAWGSRLPRLEHLSKPDQILPLLDEALATTIQCDAAPWKSELLDELELDRRRLAAIRSVAGERLSRWSVVNEPPFFLAAALSLRGNQVLRERLLEAGDATGFWKAVLMRYWRGVPGPGLLEFARSFEPRELIASLENALNESHAGTEFAFGILNALPAPGRIEFLVGMLLDEDCGDFLAVTAMRALKEAGLPAADYLMQRYAGMSERQRTEVLAVLEAFPTPGVVDFFLTHFEEYMRSQDSREFLELLETIGASAFLPPLLREWRTGETAMSRAIKLIAEINNVRDGKIHEAVREIPVPEKSPKDLLKQPIRQYAFRCGSCGRTYHYDLKRVYIGRDGQPYIGDVIECKGCGTIGDSELTHLGHLAITAELLRTLSLAEKSGKKATAEDSPIKLGQRVKAQALGREVKSANEAYVLLKNAIEKSPASADLQRRMGNVLRNGGKHDLALPYFLEAVRLDPEDADARWLLSDTLTLLGKYREAIPHLESLVPLLRESKLDEKFRRDMFSALLDQVHTIKRETGHHIELFPRTKPDNLAKSNEPVTLHLRTFDLSKPADFDAIYHAFRYGRVPPEYLKRPRAEDAGIEETGLDEEPGKQTPIVRADRGVGRNDPCPCGSGKKYKKCCGR